MSEETRESIYWMGSICGRYIKQGWTNKSVPNGRIGEHRNAKNQAIKFNELLVYVSGTKQEEGVLKKYFEGHVVSEDHGTEIFHATGLLPYLQWLRMQWFSRHDPEGREVPDFTVPTLWLPNSLRVSTARREWDLETELVSRDNPWWFLSDEVVDSDEQYITPAELLEAVRTALGGVIDFDPASDSCSNRHVRATQYLTETLDGLSQSWKGPNGRPRRIWMSVPYKQMEKWLKKLRAEMLRGNVSEAVLLAETRMLAANYFQPFLKGATVCIVNGQYQFGGKGANMPSTQDRQILVYFGAESERFTEAVRHLGHVYQEVA